MAQINFHPQEIINTLYAVESQIVRIIFWLQTLKGTMINVTAVILVYRYFTLIGTNH